MADDDSIENLFACQAESDADSAPQIISRQDAIALGFNTFYTGKPCKQGHIAERRIKGGKCIVCCNERHKIWSKLNKEKISENHKAWVKANPEKVNALHKKWREVNKEYVNSQNKAWVKSNPEKVKTAAKRWRQANPEKVKVAVKRWQQTNPEKVNAATKKWQQANPEKIKNYFNERYSEDFLFNLISIVRNRLHKALQNVGKKSQRTMAYIGCTPNELADYLELQFKKEMTWANIGTVWEIDHIVAFCTVDCADDEELKRVAHYTNLQPLFVEEHKKKTVEDVKKKFKHKIDPNYSCLIELDLLE